MEADLQKIHSLIHTCKEPNIREAFRLAALMEIPEKEVVEPWSEFFRLRVTYTSTAQGPNKEEKLIRILCGNEIYARDYALNKLPKNIHRLQNLTSLYLAQNYIQDFPIPENGFPVLSFLLLSDNKITSFPSHLAELPALHSLILDENPIGVIPAEIQDFPNLFTLGLDRCDLTEIHENIGTLKQLDSISLEGNYLTSLPETFCDLRMTDCYLADNNIAVFPENIGNMQSLSILDISGNPCSAEELQRIKTALPRCEIITEKSD